MNFLLRRIYDNIPETLLILLFLGLYIFQLGNYGLIETTDARYIEISAEMLDSGDWLIPRVNGFIHLHKPPFVYWMGAMGMEVFGRTPFGARIPQAIFVFLLLMLIYFYVRRVYTRKTAQFATTIAGTCQLLLFGARGLNTDVFLLFFVTLSLLTYLLYLRENRPIWNLLFWVGLSFAMLVKGPVPVLIIILVILAERLLPGEKMPVRPKFWLIGLIFFCLINLPWYLTMFQRLPGLFSYFIFDQLLSRVGSSGQGHPRPFYYFFYIFPALTFPWSLYLASLYNDRHRFSWIPENRAALIWLIVPLIFFSLPSTKLGLYIIPVIPPLAILLAVYFQQVSDAQLSFPRRMTNVLIFTHLLLLFALYWFSANHQSCLSDPNLARLTMTTLLFLIPVLIAFLFLRFSRMRRFLVFVLLFFVLTLHMSLFGQIGILEDHFIKSFQKFSAEMKRIATHEQYTLFQYRTFYPSMAFYQKKFSVLVNFEKDIRFDPPEVKNRLLPDVDAIFTEQSRFSAPHFVLLPQDCLSDFAKYSVEVLLRKQKMLLLKLPAVEQSTATN